VIHKFDPRKFGGFLHMIPQIYVPRISDSENGDLSRWPTLSLTEIVARGVGLGTNCAFCFSLQLLLRACFTLFSILSLVFKMCVQKPIFTEYQLLWSSFKWYWTQSPGKGNTTPVQAQTNPKGCRRLRLPGFSDNWHMKVARLSALCTSCLYPPGKKPGTHFC
jgi:hypothetical protein